MAVEKMAEKIIEKRPKEKIIIWRVIFRRLLIFSIEIFFTLIGFNVWTNFIRIIWLNVWMLFKATIVCHSAALPPRPSGPSAPWTPFYFRACLVDYLTQKKTVKGKGKGPFYSSAIFSMAIFFPIPIWINFRTNIHPNFNFR